MKRDEFYRSLLRLYVALALMGVIAMWWMYFAMRSDEAENRPETVVINGKEYVYQGAKGCPEVYRVKKDQ